MTAMSTTKILMLVVVLLLILIYTQYYSKYNEGYEIVQTYLDKINVDLLYERNPVIIYDSIKNPKQLLGTLFKYSYVFVKEYIITPNTPTITRAKFSYVYSTQGEGDVHLNLINPSYKNQFSWKRRKNGLTMSETQLSQTTAQFVTIKLKPYQVVIVPSHWIVDTDTPLTKVDLHDLFSQFYFTMW